MSLLQTPKRLARVIAVKRGVGERGALFGEPVGPPERIELLREAPVHVAQVAHIVFGIVQLIRRQRARFPVGARVQLGKLVRSEEHTSELQSQSNLVCRLLLEKKNTQTTTTTTDGVRLIFEIRPVGQTS